MRLSLKLGIALAILTLSTMAFAGAVDIGTLRYSSANSINGISVQAELFGTSQGVGEWLVTGMTGIFRVGATPYTITGMVPLGTDSAYAYDNLFWTSGVHVDSTGGLLFSINGGAHENLWFNDGSGDQWTNGARGYMNSTGEGDYVTTPVRAEFTATPEPSTLLTLGSGILGLAGLARKRLFN